MNTSLQIEGKFFWLWVKFQKKIVVLIKIEKIEYSDGAEYSRIFEHLESMFIQYKKFYCLYL